MIELRRIRYIAQRAAAQALQANLRMADKKGMMNVSAVTYIATQAALMALRDHTEEAAREVDREVRDTLGPMLDREDAA